MRRPARGRSRRAGACRRTVRADRRFRSRRGRSGRWRPARACASPPAAGPCASSPSSTFSSTVSQGNSAKLWNTIAMPGAGPAIGWPRYSSAPPLGRDRPAIRRSKVDLPEPERPEQADDLAFLQGEIRRLPARPARLAVRSCGRLLRTSCFDAARICSPGMAVSSGQPILALGVAVRAAARSSRLTAITNRRSSPRCPARRGESRRLRSPRR